jgi:hypothetical protein
MRTNQAPVATSLFYTESSDANGTSWTGDRKLLFPEETQLTNPRVLGSETEGFVMYFLRGQDVIRTTSLNGLDKWGTQQIVLSGVNGFDIVEVESEDVSYRMFVGDHGSSIRSFSSDDGIAWSLDDGVRLTSSPFGQSVIDLPVVAEIEGTGRMYLYSYPDRGSIRSATAVPEPATLSLLALGGLALLRRKSSYGG